jgi:hypothetical protein
MGDILWGLLEVLWQTNKTTYWAVFGALVAIVLAVPGWAYFSGHLVR